MANIYNCLSWDYMKMETGKNNSLMFITDCEGGEEGGPVSEDRQGGMEGGREGGERW